MRIIAACTVLLAIGVLAFTAAGADEDPAPLVLTARIVRGAVEDLPGLELGKTRVLEEKELAKLLQAFDAVAGGESVTRVTADLRSGGPSEFSVTDLERISYVADYDNAGGLVKPIRRTMREGTILDVKATPPAEGAFVTLEFRVTCAALTRPIATFSTSTTGPPLTIELPELAVQRTKESVTVPVGGWAGYRATADTLILLGAETAPAGESGSGLSPDLQPR